MAKIVTFGELMIRLQPYNYERFVQADHLEFSFGGGEANVAVSLANYGLDAAFVTKLPAHAIGQAAVDSLRRYGVDTSRIVRGGDRVGIYFNEKGASQRGSVCIYDRAHSAIQEASTSDFDWEAVFENRAAFFQRQNSRIDNFRRRWYKEKEVNEEGFDYEAVRKHDGGLCGGGIEPHGR